MEAKSKNKNQVQQQKSQETLVLFFTAAESRAIRSHMMSERDLGDSMGDGPKGILLF